MSDTPPICQETAQATLTDALNLFVGRGRRYSLASLAAATGIGERTLKSYQQGEATPGYPHLLRLLAVLPVEFGDAVLAPAGVGRLQRIEGEEPDGFTAMEQVCRRAAMLGSALADRKIDHRERLQLLPEIRALAAEMTAFAAGLEAAS